MFKPYADPDKQLTDRQSQFLPKDKKKSHPCISSSSFKRYDDRNDKMNDPGCASGPLEKEKKRKAVRGCISGFTVCLGLISYTFLGAVLFVMIEGEGFADKNNRIPNDELLTTNFGSESRERAVENIWEITVNLNILYRENWTKLASQEISRFQEKLIQHLSKELGHSNEKEKDVQGSGGKDTNWDLARSLLYSITILTTTGYGKMGPKTMLGKTVTMIYAAIGIPLMLIYLSSIGNLLSDCTLSIFNRNLCCSCRNKNAKEKQRAAGAGGGGGERLNLEPFYIRSPSKSIAPDNYSCPENIHKASTLTINHFSNSNSMSFDPSGSSCYKSTFLSICLCLAIMVAYVCCGASVLCVLERNWSYLDGIFFCFMTLSTINFVDTVPSKLQTYGDMTVWFFSLYILSGMALTAMCFNIFHKEVVYRLETYSAPTPPPPLPLTKNDLVKPSVS